MTAADELTRLTAIELRRLLAEGELTVLEVTRAHLDRIDRLNGELRAFLTPTPARAIERAAALDAERRHDDARARDLDAAPIWGLPFGDKDLTERAGVVTTFGSRAFDGYVPDRDSRLVADLDRAGGVSLGKTNTPEFGFPSYTENRLGPPARNPWDRATGPGGSSGGAAVAVAARLLPLAPGSDGGGSIRIPAAACGLVGLKPSRGRVPGGSGVDGAAGLAVAGPIARTAVDAALLLDGLLVTAADWRHALRAPAAEPGYVRALHRQRHPGRLRVAVSTWSPWAPEYATDADDAHLRALETTANLLERRGHEVVRLDSRAGADAEGTLDGTGYAAAFRTVWQAGAAALPLEPAALERVEPLTRWLVEVGRTRTAGELARAVAQLAAFEQRVIHAYRGFDVVLTPALAMSPRPIGWYDAEDGERNFAQQVEYTPYTSYVNVTGLPAIAIPVSRTAGPVPTPVGVQAIGRAGDELGLLRLAALLEDEFGTAGAPGFEE